MDSTNEASLFAADAIAKFGKDFYTANGYNRVNLVSSPMSLHFALGMLRLGARGETAADLSKTLYASNDPTFQEEGTKRILSLLNSCSDVELGIANRIYVEKGYPLNSEFINALERAFQSSIESVNMNEAVKIINAWVESFTKEKIMNLLSPDMIRENTRLVLVNAVYFYAPWLNPFMPSNTFHDVFHADGGLRVWVPFMHNKAEYHYAMVRDIEAEILVIPYANDAVSLVLIIPIASSCLPKVEKYLETCNFAELLHLTRYTFMQLNVPKFKVETYFELTDLLSTKMGLARIFNSNADFSGISSEGGLKVSSVIHKAFIEFSEQGTEAAAATAICMTDGVIKRLTVDRPFMFKIIHKIDNQVTELFGGHIGNPSD